MLELFTHRPRGVVFSPALAAPEVVLAFQGVDGALFSPRPRPAPPAPPARFVVFSGGKLEHRKAQDVAVAAFRAFLRRNPGSGAELVAAWHTDYPALAAGLDRAGHAAAPPVVSASPSSVAEWLVASGLKEGSFRVLGPLPEGELAAEIGRAHVALSLSRAESGTNLVATQTLAMGVPTVLSANTGHLDLIGLLGAEPPVYPVVKQGPVAPTEMFAGTDG